MIWRGGRILRMGLALLGATLIAACSSGNDGSSTQLEILQAGRDIASARLNRGQPAPERPPLTREVLNAIEDSYVEVVLERQDILAFLVRSDDRTDAAPGRIEHWRGEDGVSLTTRNGMLIATRGLRGDLLSADVPAEGQRPGPARSGEQAMFFKTSSPQQEELVLSCDLVDLGPENVDIVERRFATRHLQQRCIGGGGEVTNDYWVDAGSGIVWQSRQWAGPHLGYMRIRRLTR